VEQKIEHETFKNPNLCPSPSTEKKDDGEEKIEHIIIILVSWGPKESIFGN
jgi:hypothetical protein